MSAEIHDAHIKAWVRNAARVHPHTQKAMRDGFEQEALHTYTDRHGNDLYWRIRLRNPLTGEKWIRPMRRERSGFTLKEPEFLDGKPLYRLHDLAARPDEPVILVEGEKCADALVKIGVLATTSGAADTAGKADWGPMAGRTVTVWPDHDEAGQRYADAAADALRTLGCMVRVIDVVSLGIGSKADAVAKPSNVGNGSTLTGLAQDFRAHKDQAPKVPVLRRFKTNDTTVEKLGELLRENPTGLLVMRDELVGLISSWDKDGREGERAFYLEAWNGNGSFDTDRIGRGSIFIPTLCVSIFGGIQPDKLIAYLEQAANALANDGMLQRFQVLVYPDHRAWEWRDRIPEKDARDRAANVFETLAEFDPAALGATPADSFVKFPYFRFDDEAQEIFVEWSGELHRTKLPAEDHPIIAQHLAKYDKLFPALALILHLMDCAATGRRGPVTRQAALRAAAWCEYLEAHARRCYGLLVDDGLRAAKALAVKVRQGKLQDGFTARDIRRNQWRGLTTDEAVQAALDWLEDEDWLRTVEVGGTGPGTGRRTWRYSINPKAVNVRKSGDDHDQLA